MAWLARSAQWEEADEARWDACRRMSGCSAEDKLAWWFLWRLTRGCRQQVVTTAEAVAEDQGTKGDAGRKRLKNLRRARLIEAEHDRVRGTWLIQHVADPLEVARERQLARREADPQRELFQSDSESEQEHENMDARRAPSERGLTSPYDLRVASGPPEDRPDERPGLLRRLATEGEARPSDDRPDVRPDDRPGAPLPSVKKLNQKPSPSVTFGPPTGDRASATEGAQGAGRSSGRSSEAGASEAGPAPIGALLRGIPTPQQMAAGHRDEQQRVESYLAWLLAEIDCPHMLTTPALRIAQHVIAGEIEHREVQAKLAALNQAQASGELRGRRSQYINGAFKRLRPRERGLE